MAHEDWVKLRVEADGFRASNMPGEYHVVLLNAGGLTIPPGEPKLPEVIDLVTTSILPYIGMRVRKEELHFVVHGVEFRTDIDCIVAVMTENNISPHLPRYFWDGKRVAF